MQVQPVYAGGLQAGDALPGGPWAFAASVHYSTIMTHRMMSPPSARALRPLAVTHGRLRSREEAQRAAPGRATA